MRDALAAEQQPATTGPRPAPILDVTWRLHCDTCRFWSPEQFALGDCRRIGLLTTPSFGCSEWGAKP